jgi:hypothetical protein
VKASTSLNFILPVEQEKIQISFSSSSLRTSSILEGHVKTKKSKHKSRNPSIRAETKRTILYTIPKPLLPFSLVRNFQATCLTNLLSSNFSTPDEILDNEI